MSPVMTSPLPNTSGQAVMFHLGDETHLFSDRETKAANAFGDDRFRTMREVEAHERARHFAREERISRHERDLSFDSTPQQAVDREIRAKAPTHKVHRTASSPTMGPP